MSWQLKDKLQKVLAAERETTVFAPGSRKPFALVYPNTYNVGMTNLGYQIIYQQINSRGDTACERLFLPDKKTEQEYSRTKTPLLTLETQRPLYDFPLIGFAVSFEMDYFNVLSILESGKIPLLATERSEADPIVIIGGPCATFNPEPLADFIDAAIIGEGEEVIHELLDTYYRGRDNGLSRQDILLDIARLDGVYVPRFYQPEYESNGVIRAIRTLEDVPERKSRRWVKNLDDYAGQTVVVTDDTEFKDMFLIEIARGCGRHCRFCMAGYCFRRPRVRSLAQVAKAVSYAKKFRDKVGLVGAAISDYPEIDQLCELILAENMKMSVASLRADSLTSTLARALAASGHKTVTLAPEAASDRMRKVINKGITEEHLVNAVTMTVKAGIPNVRLYIMVGLPFETDDDIAAIVTMTRSLKAHMQSLGSNGRLTLSINPFIPKPFTPFQWLPMTELAMVDSRLKYVQGALRADKGVEVLVESPKEAYIQGVLARGDRRIAKALLEAHRQGGAKAWRKAVRAIAVDEDFYLYRRREFDEVLPWQHLNMGFDTKYLIAEARNAQQEKPTLSCASGCTRCGVCS